MPQKLKKLIQITNISTKKKRCHKLVLRNSEFELSFEEILELRDELTDYVEDTPLPEPGEPIRFGGES